MTTAALVLMVAVFAGYLAFLAIALKRGHQEYKKQMDHIDERAKNLARGQRHLCEIQVFHDLLDRGDFERAKSWQEQRLQ